MGEVREGTLGWAKVDQAHTGLQKPICFLYHVLQSEQPRPQGRGPKAAQRLFDLIGKFKRKNGISKANLCRGLRPRHRPFYLAGSFSYIR